MSFIDTLEFNFFNLEEEEEKVQKIVMGLPDIIRKKYFDDFLKGQKDPDTYVTLTWIIGLGIQHIYSKNYKLLFANIISTTFIIIQMICLVFNNEYFYLLFFLIAISFNLFDFIKSLFFSEKIIREYNLNLQYRLLNRYN
ncbi:uncharacterized protein METZ01_LOCUS325839 [marine metagenome]|jgi:hypothetical protein|uniref:TM2 domain-containing protein n=1 Tax=marine metagenome TaxID=408172 RepID=A0A382PJZ6_9ZZZZ|tara:strand:- start:61 stop:480 length:420 start_codon:yes stop_codon:yes gene_type:complete